VPGGRGSAARSILEGRSRRSALRIRRAHLLRLGGRWREFSRARPQDQGSNVRLGSNPSPVAGHPGRHHFTARRRQGEEAGLPTSADLGPAATTACAPVRRGAGARPSLLTRVNGGGWRGGGGPGSTTATGRRQERLERVSPSRAGLAALARPVEPTSRTNGRANAPTSSLGRPELVTPRVCRWQTAGVEGTAERWALLGKGSSCSRKSGMGSLVVKESGERRKGMQGGRAEEGAWGTKRLR